MILILNGVNKGNQSLSPLTSTSAPTAIYISASKWDTALVAVNWSIDNGATWTPLQATAGTTTVPLSGIAANGNWSVPNLNSVLLQAVVTLAGASTGINVAIY